MEIWYKSNLISKIVITIIFGLMLLPFLAVLIKQKSSGARLCLFIFMCVHLLSTHIFWLLSIVVDFERSEWWKQQISPFTTENGFPDNRETMPDFQKNDEQFVIRSEEHKIFAYVAIVLLFLNTIIQVFCLGVFYSYYKASLNDAKRVDFKLV